jgi:hypothetical protein
MALADVQDQLKEQFAAVWARIRESSAFIDASEKYQGLSPAAQKGVAFGGGALVFLILMAVPYSYFSGSSDLITQYEDKRDLIQNLYHIQREANAVAGRPALPVNASEFQQRAQGIVTEAALQAEQMQYVSPIPTASIPGIAKTIDQQGVEVSLKKLNLTQVIDIGYKLQAMDARSRLTGIDIKANASDRHYYDVIYRVIGFGPKPDLTPAAGAKKPKGK